MADRQYPNVHSVAFRVTDDEWRKLQRSAEKKGCSISELAKMALFEKVGLKGAALKSRR